jgi:hypothetical protein
MNLVLKSEVSQPAEFSGSVAIFVLGNSRALIGSVVGGRNTLAYHPGLYLVRNGRQSSPSTVTTCVVDRYIGRSVCLDDWYVLARTRHPLNRRVSVHVISIRSGYHVRVESARVWSNSCESPAEIRITCNKTTKATSVALSNCEDMMYQLATELLRKREAEIAVDIRERVMIHHCIITMPYTYIPGIKTRINRQQSSGETGAPSPSSMPIPRDQKPTPVRSSVESKQSSEIST